METQRVFLKGKFEKHIMCFLDFSFRNTFCVSVGKTLWKSQNMSLNGFFRGKHHTAPAVPGVFTSGPPNYHPSYHPHQFSTTPSLSGDRFHQYDQNLTQSQILISYSPMPFFVNQPLYFPGQQSTLRLPPAPLPLQNSSTTILNAPATNYQKHKAGASTGSKAKWTKTKSNAENVNPSSHCGIGPSTLPSQPQLNTDMPGKQILVYW